MDKKNYQFCFKVWCVKRFEAHLDEICMWVEEGKYNNLIFGFLVHYLLSKEPTTLSFI